MNRTGDNRGGHMAPPPAGMRWAKGPAGIGLMNITLGEVRLGHISLIMFDKVRLDWVSLGYVG